MSTNPTNQAPNATKPASKNQKRALTRGQLAIQAAATVNQEPGEIKTANNRKLRDTMAGKNGKVAEAILRERALGQEFVAGGGTLTDGQNAQARLEKLKVPVDTAGRSPSSLVAAASSSPLSERDRFSFGRGPPQTPSRTPSLSTIAQPPDGPPNPALPMPVTSTIAVDPSPDIPPPALVSPTLAPGPSRSTLTAPVQSRGHGPSTSGPQRRHAVPATSAGTIAIPPKPTKPHPSPDIPPPALVPPTLAPGPSTSTLTAPVQSRGHGPSTSGPQHHAVPATSAVAVTIPPKPMKPTSSTRPAPVPSSNPTTHVPSTSNQPANALEDPWALTNVPVRVELAKAQDFNNPLAPTTIQYVTVPLVTQHEDLYTCKLSDVFSRLADVESPLKPTSLMPVYLRLADITFTERTSKIYRLGPDSELVGLGRGDDLADPSSTRLTGNPFINMHRLQRTEKGGVEIFTGIKIFYEHQPSAQSVQRPQDFFNEDPVPRRDHTRQAERIARSGSKRPTAEANLSTSHRKRHRRQRSPSSAEEDSDVEIPFNPEHEFYPFIRQIFNFDPGCLPGHWEIKTARDALDRYKIVEKGERLATELQWRIPKEDTMTVFLPDGNDDGDVVDIPEAIQGRTFTKTDLQHVFGFNETTWWTLPQRWGKSALKGARIVQAWVEDPDATVQNRDGEEDEKYPHLNRISFNKLKSIIALDKAGGYTRLGPKADRSSDSGEHVREGGRRRDAGREGGRQREDRSRDRERHRRRSRSSDAGGHVRREGGRRREDRSPEPERRRRQSSSSHHSRSLSVDPRSSDLDDADPREAGGSRKTGSRRGGGH